MQNTSHIRNLLVSLADGEDVEYLAVAIERLGPEALLDLRVAGLNLEEARGLATLLLYTREAQPSDGEDVLLYKTSDGVVAPFFAVLSESGNADVWLPCAIPAIMTMFLSLAERDQRALQVAALRCLVKVRRSRIPILFGEQNIWDQLGLL